MELIWTREKPKEPGWYWFRRNFRKDKPYNHFPQVMLVWGKDHLRADGLLIDYYHGEWAGPLPQPTEPEGGKG